MSYIAVIHPKFKMVLVSPLMVEPGFGIALVNSFTHVGAFVAAEVFDSRPKFNRAVL